MANPPTIGITVDNPRGQAEQYESPRRYAAAVAAAGGLPVLLTQEPGCVAEYLRRCDGLVLSGGDDPRMEPWGRPTHPQARLMTPARQEFETALLRALDDRPALPVLAICLGMQMMALHQGGDLHQHLPDVLGAAAQAHQGKRRHPVGLANRVELPATHPLAGLNPTGLSKGPALKGTASDKVQMETGATVVSSHHQAVSDPGDLRVVATAPDGVIEAVDDPARPFYVGVQWHPELGGGESWNLGLFTALVRAATKNGTGPIINVSPTASLKAQ